MKLNFRKIASVLASAVMLGSTVGTALAANYPAPFVSGGAADGAIVVTSGTHLGASSDLFAAVDLQNNLQGQVTGTSSGTTGSVSGEAAALFTGSSKLFYNDTLNNVKTVVTKAEMPISLIDGSFSGNVDATYTSTIYLGSNPQFTYAKMPTSSSDPSFGYTLSTSTTNYIYNASVTFNKAVNFAHADSKNTDLTLFGQKFTVSSSSDASNLVLLKEATKVTFDSSGATSSDVTVAGKAYTVSLVSASTNTATVLVTNKDTGTSDQKEVSEGYSKKINGVLVAVNTADSNNLKYTASIVVGAEKYTLADGGAVTFGDEGTVIDGTYVRFTNTTGTAGIDSLTKIVVSVSAKNSDVDALLPGDSLVDPVFGNFKLAFAGLNVPENGTARETIKVAPSGNDKMYLTMTDYNGVTKSLQYLYNRSVGRMLEWDTDGHQIATAESANLNRSDYAVVGNENEGHLIKVTTITNQTTGYSNDKVVFTDLFTDEQYTTTITSDGVGTVTIGGKVYTVNYYGDSTLSDEAKTVRLNYPDSSTSTDMIIYPTITTSKGAKVFFYKPVTVNITNWDGKGTGLAGGNVKLPTFDNGYLNVPIVNTGSPLNFSLNGVVLNSTGNSGTLVTVTNTGLKFNFTYGGSNSSIVYLYDTKNNVNVADPAIVVMEEKDDNSNYNGMIVTATGSGSTAAPLGVSSIIRTWSAPGQTTTTLASDSNKEKIVDLWGTVGLLDKTDSDQAIATISYPDEQIYAQVYIAAKDAVVTPGQSAGSAGGVISVVKDTDVATVSGKNLIVVGGSCINTVAAKLLGSDSALCGADFTAKTNADSGKYIIKSFTSPYNTAKIAVLVAGYESAQTVDAVAKLKEGLSTDVGSSKIGPTTA